MAASGKELLSNISLLNKAVVDCSLRLSIHALKSLRNAKSDDDYAEIEKDLHEIEILYASMCNFLYAVGMEVEVVKSMQKALDNHMAFISRAAGLGKAIARGENSQAVFEDYLNLIVHQIYGIVPKK